MFLGESSPESFGIQIVYKLKKERTQFLIQINYPLLRKFWKYRSFFFRSDLAPLWLIFISDYLKIM